jgi:hypothetical protein
MLNIDYEPSSARDDYCDALYSRFASRRRLLQQQVSSLFEGRGKTRGYKECPLFWFAFARSGAVICAVLLLLISRIPAVPLQIRHTPVQSLAATEPHFSHGMRKHAIRLTTKYPRCLVLWCLLRFP